MPLDIDAIRARRPQSELHYFPVIDSTMREAARLAATNAPHRATVLADEQTAGVGRLGRSWHSEADSGVYCSVLLRLPLPPSQLPLATLVLGLATADAIQNSTGVACDLRWPNDVLVNGKKVAGILAQLVDTCVVAGIGINVNHSALPDDLRTPATSLFIESGSLQSREDLVAALLDSLDTFADLLQTRGSEAIIRSFTAASSYANNRRVVLEETGQRGTTAGLDAQGFLKVRLDSGVMERVASGGVRPERF